MHKENSFLTLTYSDENLPPDGGLCVRDLQLFMKRLRKDISPVKVRYYAAGEYGDRTWRPHYHVVLFGYGFPDRALWRKSPSGYDLFRSPRLERLWPHGHSEIGTVTAESGGYVARYVLKKINGQASAAHYSRPHPVTGEIFDVEPEFALMSSRPGIGGAWFEEFSGDCFPSDFLVLDGTKTRIPRYFFNKIKVNPHNLYYGTYIDGTAIPQSENIRKKRKAYSQSPQAVENSTPERLAVREECASLRLEQLKRELE